jgi:hypothetical protein
VCAMLLLALGEGPGAGGWGGRGGIGVSGVHALRVSEKVKGFVCTETFKAGLTSFFTQRDTKAAFAEDQSELCELCAKVMRLAYLYSNDVQTQDKWETALTDNACRYVSVARRTDCNGLTKGIIASQRSFFTSKQAKFKPAELKGTTNQMELLVDSKSYFQCKAIGCCPVVPKRKGPTVMEPCSKPGDAKEVDKDREALSKDRFYMDAVRDELFTQRRQNNKFKAKLDLKETDLEGREKKLKKDREVLQQDQGKLREATEALKKREDKVSRREKDEKELRAYNKKREKWLKTREDNISDREDICYKREDQLGLPHPPKTSPPPPPPPPKPPATERPVERGI